MARLAAKAKADVARGDLAAAAADYAAAVNADPKNPRLRLAFGNVLLALHDYAGAILQFSEAQRLAPASVDAPVGLATAYRGAHNFDEARQTLEAAHKAHPSAAAPLAELGDLEIELQAYDAAIGAPESGRRAVADQATCRRASGCVVAYKAKGDADERAGAGVSFDSGARHRDNALAHYTRAQIYSDRNQDSARAAKTPSSWLKLQPQNRRGRALLGKILLRVPAGRARRPRQTKARCDEAVATLEPLNADPATPADSDALFLAGARLPVRRR